MIEHEILFLGLLMERPMHGYDIKCKIHDELEAVIGLNVKSIYYPLKKLEGAGMIKQGSNRQGKGPEKITYSITPKGRKRFDQLITKSLMSIERPFFHINLSLYFLVYVDKQEAIRRLKTRIVLLNRVCQHLEQSFPSIQSKSPHLTCIIQHDLDLCLAEIDSISRLLKQLSV